MTQQEVAKLTGIPQTTIAYWERTGNLTGRRVIMKMAKSLGVSVAELLRVRK